VGRTAAVDRCTTLGGSYGVEGRWEGAVGVEVAMVATTITQQTTLLAELHRLE
jgi:hypothetical protein